MDLAVDQTVNRPRRPLTHNLIGLGLKPVRRVAYEAELLAGRRCGCIVIDQVQLEAIYGRWWPFLGNMLQVWWDRQLRCFPRDRCELYYHTPLSMPGFLTLSYVRAGPLTSLSTFYAATLVLDEVARVRRANAIVCNVTNNRISDRLMHRWGWEEHCQDWSGRHFIKRFYGRYPKIKSSWRRRLNLD